MIIQNKYINNYMEDIRKHPCNYCKEQHLLIKNVLLPVLQDNDVTIDNRKVDEGIAMMEEYFHPLFPWEKFIFAVMNLIYHTDDTVVFRKVLMMLGRGNGKTGYLSALGWYFTTKHHGIKNYHVAVVANSEDQSKKTYNAIYDMLEDRRFKLLMKKSFTWNKEGCTNKATRSNIAYYTSNSKTKDGEQPGLLIFDEEHAYENYDNVNVFTSSLGKCRHPRIVTITTDGYVRGGVLDDDKELARLKLDGDASMKKYRLFPFICKMDNIDEVENEECWIKANPSLPFLSSLKNEMEQAFIEAKLNSQKMLEFYTKRMNLPKINEAKAVAGWEKIKALTKFDEKGKMISLPDMRGWDCVAGIDYASYRDFVGCYLLFKKDRKYYGIHHTFICKNSPDLPKIKFPIDDAIEKGFAEYIDAESIDEDIVAEWFFGMSKLYNIKKICCDNHRFFVLAEAFKKFGWYVDDGKNGGKVLLVRNGNITHSLVSPEVEKIFQRELLQMEDDSLFRWYTNNVFVERNDKGNVAYKKIDAETRKTDGFMAFIHALSEAGKYLVETVHRVPRVNTW